MEAAERYKIAREHLVCPDCGSDLVVKLMTDIDPNNRSDYLDDQIGIKCTGYNKEAMPPHCPYWAFAGERMSKAAE